MKSSLDRVCAPLYDTVSNKAEAIIQNVATVVVAPERVIRLGVASLLAGGHLLLNDLPGVGKTLLAKSIAQSIGATFKRIQFTPDLLPTDITGASIYDQNRREFHFVRGPVFSQVVLADEINRASSRTQSALLEAMGERQVSVDGETYPLGQPFWVVATQNQVDPYGTFPLPHAQLDRFLMSLRIGYPSEEEQVDILERSEHGDPVPSQVLGPQDICELQDHVQQVEVARPVKEYISRILAATREHPDIVLGASPRGGVQLQRAAQAWAALEGRSFATPDDVKAVVTPVLDHRLIITPSSASDRTPADVVDSVMEKIPVPV